MRILFAAAASLALFASPAFAKDPAEGKTTFFVYESFMSPQQQPGEETEQKLVQKVAGLEGTAPPTPREQRKSTGWGQIRVARDMSRAFVDVEIKGVKPEDIIMFHIHCGPPTVLGPILVDLGKFGDLPKMLAQGKLSVEVKNADLSFITRPPHGMKPVLPETCPIDIGFDQTKTISGLDYLARKGVLYFNLHTKAHTFFGEMRGQIHAAEK